MKELITVAQADMILRILAIVGPILGITLGPMIGCAKKRPKSGIVWGLITGFSGTAMYGLWRFYITTGEGFGYSSIANLIVQLLLFIVLGIGAGAAIQTLLNGQEKPKDDNTSNKKSRSIQEDKINAS
ncbi:MAG TPA: hypothetical protein PLU88_02910 [Armatimonadota bacterium]|nr:hypothetical protein [Armatimonadota bacterium]HOM72262.1 hypothetical protein [Armatimonadota bacterium]HOP79860.1 hypothetical protein [Armatimonadota bacterium]HPP74063.1 hypothetical protein [Armatimonadota bacterium]